LSRRLLADQMRAWPLALSSATASCKATARAKSGGIRATWPWLPAPLYGYPLELFRVYTVLPTAEGNGQAYAASSMVQARLARSSSDLQRATGTRSERGGPRPCRWPAGGRTDWNSECPRSCF
jgi:hypothetical protein